MLGIRYIPHHIILLSDRNLGQIAAQPESGRTRLLQEEAVTKRIVEPTYTHNKRVWEYTRILRGLTGERCSV